MRYSRIIHYDPANGPGIRSTIFLTGCNIHCKGCFNYEIQDFNSGNILDESVLNDWILHASQPTICGISILGGEPFDQNLSELNYLFSKLSTINKPIWVWSGHTFETLISNSDILNILDTYVTTLVDGPFDEAKKDLKLRFRGSSNQRIINVAKSLKSGHIVLDTKYMK